MPHAPPLRRTPPAPLLLAMLAALAACGTGTSSQGVQARDSAGVAVVSSTAGAVREAPRWRLADTARVEIGGAGGRPGEELRRAAGAGWLSDGRIVVANAGTGQLRFHAADGHLQTTAGREGGGPGESRDLGWMAVARGDSVLVHGGRLGRVSVFDAAGRVVRSFRLEGDGAPLLLAPAGLFSDGTLLVRGIRPVTRPAAGVVRDSVTLLRFGRTGAPLDTLATLPLGTRRATAEGGTNVVDAPLSAMASFAAEGPGLWYAPGQAPQVDRRSRRGVLVRSIRWDAGDLRLSPAEAERFRRDQTEGTVAHAPLPAVVPAISDIVPGAEGELWVRPFPRPGQDSLTWLVLRGDGRIRARLVLPRGTRVLAVAREEVLVAEPGADGVERVRLRAVVQP